ncbi:hypothetical protein [Nocardia terrae]|uniref:hypothetical protein n=1 Tax=Nocardia terrae TaxID=2675851 RepID=UPI0018DF5106|nr:hypothetical protein [Nocardia terrae]
MKSRRAAGLASTGPPSECRLPTSSGRDWGYCATRAAALYTPDLNPGEGVWSALKRSIGNLLTDSIDHLATIIRSHLATLRRHTDSVLDGFLAETGPTLDPITS